MNFSSPASGVGYYRGSPGSMGSGSNQGTNSGVGGMAGGNVFTAGQGPDSGTGWSPTILYLFALIVAEMFIFGIIARKL
jgi:hypothetical protein